MSEAVAVERGDVSNTQTDCLPPTAEVAACECVCVQQYVFLS